MINTFLPANFNSLINLAIALADGLSKDILSSNPKIEPE
jgi:hypothetical protein